MSTPIIKVDAISKSFGSFKVLDGLSMQVMPGEKLALIGPSGSGKTTILRILMTLEKIDGGHVQIDGEQLYHMERNGQLLPADERHLTKMRQKIGMVFQLFNLFPHKCVMDNVTLAPMLTKGTPRAAAEKRAMELLDMVGMSDKAKSMPAQLSGGQKQRVAIARALALSPKIMLFDEPTSSLDPELTGEVLNVMRDLAAEGMTMVVVSHEIGFAATVGQQIAFLDHGRIVFTGPPQEVFRKPRNARLEQFLDTYLDRGASMLL